MKKVALILALLMLLCGLFGCAQVPAEDVSADAATDTVIEEIQEETAPAEEPLPPEEFEQSEEDILLTYGDLYLDTINYFYNFVLGSAEDEYRGGEMGISEALGSEHNEAALDKIGYDIRDLSGDGLPELIIGLLPDPEYPHMMGSICAVYALGEEAEVTCTFEGSSRSNYILLNDGSFLYQGSAGAAYSIFGTYSLSSSGAELICSNFYFTHEKDGNFEDIRVYHNTTGDWDANASEETDIPLDQFNEMYLALAENKVDPQLKPISGYAVG